MAARENEAQDIVLQNGVLRCVFRKPFAHPVIGHEVGFDLLALGEKAHVPPQTIDRLVAADIDEPGAGICRDAFARPLNERGGEGILHRIFGEFEIAEQAYQRGQNAAAFIAEQQCDLIRHVWSAISSARGSGLSIRPERKRSAAAIADASCTP